MRCSLDHNCSSVVSQQTGSEVVGSQLTPSTFQGWLFSSSSYKYKETSDGSLQNSFLSFCCYKMGRVHPNCTGHWTGNLWRCHLTSILRNAANGQWLLRLLISYRGHGTREPFLERWKVPLHISRAPSHQKNSWKNWWPCMSRLILIASWRHQVAL